MKAPALCRLAVVLLAALAGCRQPIDEQLLRVVEDKIPPDITLSSPVASGAIRSTTLVAGRITDSSFRAGDRGGVLDTITIQVQSETALARTVKLASSSFTVTPADPTFTYNHSTGDFAVELDTHAIDRSREFIVTATDRNGNGSEVRRTLFASDGMRVALTEPGSTFTGFNVGDFFLIQGTVANSASDSGIGELHLLKWEVVQNPSWSALLDLTPGAEAPDHTLYDKGTQYSATINGPLLGSTWTFDLDKSSGAFASTFLIPASGLSTLTVKVTATDWNGIERTVEKTVTEKLDYPTFALNLPDPKYGTPPSKYYSGVLAPVHIAIGGYMDNPSQVAEIRFVVQSTSGGSYSNTYSGATLGTVMDASGNLSFDVDTTGMHGNITATVTAKSLSGLQSPFPVTIKDDPAPPAISAVSITSDNTQSGGPHARIGNTVTLTFGATDTASGVATLSSSQVKFAGNDALSFVSLGANNYRATYQLTGSEPSPLTFQIAPRDNIGNVASVSSTGDGSSITFYAGAPTIGSLALHSTGNPGWATTGNTATLSFSVPRTLASAPAVQIAGRVASVSWTPPNCSATMVMQAGDPQGTIPFQIDITDAAGNPATFTQATSTPSPTVTYDSIAPAAPSVPDLAAGSDTGASNSDNITRLTSLTFTGTAEAGATVAILVDGSSVATGTATGGAYSIVAPVTAGSHSITATATDAAGNTSGASAGLSVTVDTSISPAPSTPDLAAANDSGSSNSDNITNNTSLRFTGTTEAGATVEILVDGSAAASGTATGGNYDITVNPVAAGTHNISARATDTAGNTATSAALSVTVDTSISPPSTPDLDAASDTGASNSDNITRLTSLTFTGSAEAGATVTILVDGSSVATGTATGGAYSIVAPVTAGSHSITATATDIAGNSAASAGGLPVTVDTSAPSAPSTPDLDAASDTGASNSDNITRLTSLTFTGTAEAGATVAILVDGSSVATGTATGGAYSIVAPVTAGSHSITATATDAAGNTSGASAGLSVTVDTSISPAPSTPDLAAANDSGSSNSDNITNNTSLRFTGTTEAGATVEILVDGSAAASGTATGGNYDITVNPVAAGTHNISARATDTAGNTATSAALSVTVDTSISPPSTPDLDAASDTGASNSDNITRLTSLTFTGSAEAGATVTILVDGSSVATGTATGGAYSIVAPVTAGSHSITATATDIAGNSAASAGGLPVTVDTSAPSAPSTPDLDAASDTGASNSDNITRLTSLTFTGTAEAGATVAILVDGSSVATGTATGGAYSIVAPVTAGSHSITATATDAAGNTSGASAGLSVTVDTSISPAPSTPDLAAANDSGSSNSDNITNNTSLRFTGTTEAGATVEILVDGSAAASGTATGGNYDITVNPVAAGTHNISARATDTAGNTATSAALSVTVDTSISPPSTPDLDAASDTGASNSDNITRLTSLTFTGSAEAGATVTILVDGSSVATGTATGGNYSIVAPVTAGSHSITATATDIAGNSSSASAALSPALKVDTASPTVSTFTPSDAELVAADSGSLTLTFVYSEPMDTTINPTITFDTDVSSRLTAGPSFVWGTSTTVTASYTVVAGGTDPAANVGVTVRSARDEAGNVQEDYASTPSDFKVSLSVAGAPVPPGRGTAAGGGPASIQSGAASRAGQRFTASVPESPRLLESRPSAAAAASAAVRPLAPVAPVAVTWSAAVPLLAPTAAPAATPAATTAAASAQAAPAAPEAAESTPAVIEAPPVVEPIPKAQAESADCAPAAWLGLAVALAAAGAATATWVRQRSRSEKR